MVLKKLYIDAWVKVRLTEAGKRVYRDWSRKNVKLEPEIDTDPVDEDGFAMFNLLTFMSIFGDALAAGVPEVVEDDYIYIADADLI